MLCFCSPVPDTSFLGAEGGLPRCRTVCSPVAESVPKKIGAVGKNSSYLYLLVLVLDSCKFQYLFDCRIQSVNILATGSCEVWLTAATALNQFGSFFHQIAGFQTCRYQIVAQHYCQHRLAVVYTSGYEE